MKSIVLEDLANSVMAGDYLKAVELTSTAMEQGVSAREILAKGLSKGMITVSETYAEKGMYLDNIILSAIAFEMSLKYLEPQLKKERKEIPLQGKIVLGVMGGPWTIGKNVVAANLRAHGFDIVDAGSDVSPETIAKKALEVDADIVASAIFLAHTTSDVKKLEEELLRLGIRNKIRTMVSGPAASEKVAAMYGVDAHVKDVIEVVERAKKFMEDIKSEMTSMDRVMTTLKLKEPDRVPVVPFPQRFSAKFAGIPFSKYCSKAEALAKAQVKAYKTFGWDAVVMSTDVAMYAEACGAKSHMPYDDVPRIIKPAIRMGNLEEDFKNLEMPDLSKAGRVTEGIKAVELMKKELGDEVPVIGWTEGPFQGTTLLFGADPALVIILKEEPNLFKEIIEWYADFEFEVAKAMIDAGADIIGSGETAAFFMSPETYLEFAYPFEKRVYQKITNYGAPVLIHCCGFVPQCIPYAPEVNPGGAIQFDYEVDLAWAKSTIGEKMTIMGNLDGNMLALASVEETEKACRDAIRIAAKGGGYWLSYGCEIPKNMPYENVRAMLKVAKTYGKYPLKF